MGLGWEQQEAGGDAGELRAHVARTVRALRASSGRSLADLARDAGIGKSTLHAIESGDANPGIETLWALARALQVPFGSLLEPPSPQIRVVRAGQGPRVDGEDASMQAHLLATCAHGSRVELYALRLWPSAQRDASAHAPGTVEHVLVVSGRLEVGPADGEVELSPGDLASFGADGPHRYHALEDPTEAILLIEYP